MFKKSAGALAQTDPRRQFFLTTISFFVAGLRPTMARPCSARQSCFSCQACLPLSCWGSPMKARNMLAGGFALKCCAAQMASKGIENSWQGLLKRCVKPWRTMLHRMMKNLTRRGTSLVPGFGTENVPKIEVAFWKAFLFRNLFVVELPLRDDPSRASASRFELFKF